MSKEFLSSTGYLPDDSGEKKPRVGKLGKIALASVLAYTPVLYYLLPPEGQNYLVETWDKVRVTASLYNAKIKQWAFVDEIAKQQLRDEILQQLNSTEKNQIDFADFFLRAERDSGQCNQQEYDAACKEVRRLTEEFVHMKETKPDPVEVLHYILQKRKFYKSGSASLINLLLSGKGNCEAIAKFTEMMVQKVLPEIDPARIKVLLFRDHVAILFDDVTGQRYLLEKPTPRPVDKEDLDRTAELPHDIWIRQFVGANFSVTYHGSGMRVEGAPGKGGDSDTLFDLNGLVPAGMLKKYSPGPVPALKKEEAVDFHEAQKALEPDKEQQVTMLGSEFYLGAGSNQKNIDTSILESSIDAKQYFLNRELLKKITYLLEYEKRELFHMRLINEVKHDPDFLKRFILAHPRSVDNEFDPTFSSQDGQGDGFGGLVYCAIDSIEADEDFFMHIVRTFPSWSSRLAAVRRISKNEYAREIFDIENQSTVLEVLFSTTTDFSVLKRFASLSDQDCDYEHAANTAEKNRRLDNSINRDNARERILGLRKGEVITKFP